MSQKKMKIYEVLQFCLLTKRKRKKKGLIRDKVRIENVEMKIIK